LFGESLLYYQCNFVDDVFNGRLVLILAGYLSSFTHSLIKNGEDVSIPSENALFISNSSWKCNSAIKVFIGFKSIMMIIVFFWNVKNFYKICFYIKK